MWQSLKKARALVACFLLLSFFVDDSKVEAIRIPFLGKKKYTPLLFFTVPKDQSAENDALEKCISEIEKELGVRVERLDILRDPPNQALLGMLTRVPPPFLYNRDSCQSYHVSGTIDKSRVRAWAKGRYLPLRKESASGGAQTSSPVLVSKKDNSINQDELLNDLDLTPLQKKGKEAIKERTEQKAKN